MSTARKASAVIVAGLVVGLVSGAALGVVWWAPGSARAARGAGRASASRRRTSPRATSPRTSPSVLLAVVAGVAITIGLANMRRDHLASVLVAAPAVERGRHGGHVVRRHPARLGRHRGAECHHDRGPRRRCPAAGGDAGHVRHVGRSPPRWSSRSWRSSDWIVEVRRARRAWARPGPSGRAADGRVGAAGDRQQVGRSQADVEATAAAADVHGVEELGGLVHERRQRPLLPDRARCRRARTRSGAGRWRRRPSRRVVRRPPPPVPSGRGCRSRGRCATTARPSTMTSRVLNTSSGSRPSAAAASSPKDAARGSCS